MFFGATAGLSSSKVTASPLPATSQVTAPALQESSPAAIQATLPASQIDAQKQPASATNSAQPAAPKAEELTQPQATPPPPPGTEQLLPPSPAASHPELIPQPVASTSSPDAAAAIHIELSAIQPTWLSISADGKTTYSGTLAAMKTMSFDGKETAQIRTANAGGVNIIFNGRALGALGRPGQSRTFVFTKSGYEVVQGVGGSLSRVLPTGGL